MITSQPKAHSPLLRIVPTILACALMSSPAFAAVGDPTFSIIPVATHTAGIIGDQATVDVVIDWGYENTGFDPRDVSDLKLYKKATAAVIGTDTPLTIAASDVISLTTTKAVVRVSSITAGDSVWAAVPAAATLSNAGVVAYPSAAFPGTTTTTKVYTYIAAAPVVNQFAITSPSDNSATTSRLPSVSGTVNIDDDTATTGATAKNVSFGTSSVWTVEIYDGSTLVGSTPISKTGSAATTTTNKQNFTVNLNSPLQAGTHSLTAKLKDPFGVLVGSATAASNLLVWDAPTLNLDGNSMTVGATTTYGYTKSLTFTGTKFAKSSTVLSTVSMTIDGVAPTTTSISDPTKFGYTLASLTSGASHTVVLTQTMSGTGAFTPAPTYVQNYTIDNTSSSQVIAPDAPIIASPVAGTTIGTLTPTISGQAEPNAIVSLKFTDTSDNSSTTVTGATKCTADANGAFVFNAACWNSAALTANKTYIIQLAATNKEQISSPLSPNDYTLVLDTSANTVNLDVSSSDITTYTDPISGIATKYCKTVGNITFSVAATNLTTNLGTAALANLAATDITSSLAGMTPTFASVPTALTAGAFTFTLNPPSTGTHPAGLCTIAIPAAGFQVGTKDNYASNSLTFTVDVVAPKVTATLVSKGPSAKDVGPNFDIVLTSDEPLKDTVTVGQVEYLIGTASTGTAMTGGVATFSADRKVCTIAYTGQTFGGAAQGADLKFSVPVSTVTDRAGNNMAAVATITGRTVDTSTSRTPGIAVATTILPIGKVSPMPFTITFVKPVANFGLDDLDIQNGVPASTGLVANATSDTFTLSVIPGEGPTPVKVSFKSGAEISTAANTLANVTISGTPSVSRTFDSTPPRVLSLNSSTPAPTSTDLKPTNRTSIPCSLVFSEVVTGLTDTTAPTILTVDGGTISNFTGSGSAYTFNINVSAPLTVNKPIKVVLPAGKIADGAGNLNSAAAVMVRNYDGVTPGVSIADGVLSGGASSGTGALSQVTFTITIAGGEGKTDVLASRFDASKLVVSGGTIDSITTANDTTKTDRIKTVTALVSIPRGAGNAVIIQAINGMVTDLAGNKNDTTSKTLVLSTSN